MTEGAFTSDQDSVRRSEVAGGSAPTSSMPADAAPGRIPDAPACDAPASEDPRVDDALSRLAELDGMPLAEQVEVFGDIHRRLDGVLADPDSRG